MRHAIEMMTRPVVWAELDWRLSRVAQILDRYGYSQLPVRKDGKSVGRVTDDMVCFLLEERPASEVAQLVVRELPKFGRPFEEIPRDKDENEVLKALRHDQAILVPNGKSLNEWGIITRSNFLRELYK